MAGIQPIIHLKFFLFVPSRKPLWFHSSSGNSDRMLEMILCKYKYNWRGWNSAWFKAFRYIRLNDFIVCVTGYVPDFFLSNNSRSKQFKLDFMLNVSKPFFAYHDDRQFHIYSILSLSFRVLLLIPWTQHFRCDFHSF